MEVVLSSVFEWIEKRFKKHRVLKRCLVLLVFFFWMLSGLYGVGVSRSPLGDGIVRTTGRGPPKP